MNKDNFSEICMLIICIGVFIAFIGIGIDHYYIHIEALKAMDKGYKMVIGTKNTFVKQKVNLHDKTR